MIQIILATEEELDTFDDQAIYFEYGDNYSVLVDSTGEVLYPRYYFHENGDMDGFMGWGDGP